MLDSNFNTYAASLLELDNVEDIISSLPNGKESIQDLIEFINREIESNIELKNETDDESIDLEIDRLNKIRDGLVKELSEVYDEVKTEEKKKNIVFLMTNASNPCIEKDIKDIPREYYDDLYEMLESLESFGSEEGKYNNTVCKKFTNNNSVKDVFELISFKVRLYFSQYDKDTIIVIMAALKNQTNSKVLYETLGHRVSMTLKRNSHYTLLDDLKTKLSDPETKIKLIEEHNEIKENIMEQLKGKKK